MASNTDPDVIVNAVWTCGHCGHESGVSQKSCENCGRSRSDAKLWGRPWVLQLPLTLSKAGWRINWKIALGDIVEPDQPLMDLELANGPSVRNRSPALMQVVQILSGGGSDNAQMATFRFLSPVEDREGIEAALFEQAERMATDQKSAEKQAFPDFVAEPKDGKSDDYGKDDKDRVSPYVRWFLLAGFLVFGIVLGAWYFGLGSDGTAPSDATTTTVVEPDLLSDDVIINEIEKAVRAIRLSRQTAQRREANELNIMEFANRDLDHLLEPTRQRVREQTAQLEADRNDFILSVHWLREAAESSPESYGQAWRRLEQSVESRADQRVFEELKALVDQQVRNPGPRNEINTLTWWDTSINNLE